MGGREGGRKEKGGRERGNEADKFSDMSYCETTEQQREQKPLKAHRVKCQRNELD